jgi:hypothetical protein
MKTNLIFEKEKGRVIKICNSPSEYKKALAIYQRQLPFTPRLLDDDGSITLVLEYLPGIPIGDMDVPDFAALAQLFVQLHSLESRAGHVICHHDTNPKNYLYLPEQNRYIMLDFAEWRYDFPESDLIHFLLFFASIYSRREFTLAARSFLDAYRAKLPVNPIQWGMMLEEEIERFDSRRRFYGKSEAQKNPDVQDNRALLQQI